MQQEAIRFFQRLYGEKLDKIRDLQASMFLRLDHRDILFLCKVTVDEIKSVSFYMASLKAPGNDEFYAYFFQSQWDVVGEAIYKWI